MVIESGTENDTRWFKTLISSKNKNTNKKKNNNIANSPSKKTCQPSSINHTEACVKHMCGKYRRSHDYLSCTEDSIIPTSPNQTTHIESVEIPKTKCRAHPEYPLDTLCNGCHRTKSRHYYSHLLHLL